MCISLDHKGRIHWAHIVKKKKNVYNSYPWSSFALLKIELCVTFCCMQTGLVQKY